MKIYRSLALMGLVLAALPAGSAEPPPERVVQVALASFSFTPSTITFHSGERQILELTNSSRGAHDFAAPEFFAAARITPEDAALIREGGRVEVKGGKTVSIHLTAPAPGRYSLKCTHFLHSGFGMKGEIVVR